MEETTKKQYIWLVSFAGLAIFAYYVVPWIDQLPEQRRELVALLIFLMSLFYAGSEEIEARKKRSSNSS